MIPINSSDTKKILAAVTGSLNSTIPTITAPSAPIPVQMAYEVPRGSCFVAWERNRKLKIIPTTVRIVYFKSVNPSENFIHVDQNTSSPPAMIKHTHSIISSSLSSLLKYIIRCFTCHRKRKALNLYLLWPNDT